MKHTWKRLTAMLLALTLCLGLLPTALLTTEAAAADVEYLDNVADAAEVVREAMVNRTEEVVVYYTCPADDYDENILAEIATAAMEHTGVPNEGDYLAWQGAAYSSTASISSSGGYYYLAITYTFTNYYTTAAQEEELAAKLKTVMASLDLDSKCDYQKVLAIHDYICANVTYDYTNLDNDSYTLKYTAYAALINGTAVCQGYATLFYRMALMAGLDARYISGTATNGTGETGAHGWNIVKVGNSYYNIDTTWDDGTSTNNYFLKGSDNFAADHVRDSDYTTTAFTTAYPVSDSDCSADHSWGTPGFNWAEDYSTCTATFTCSAGDGTVTVDCTVTSGGKDATCTTDGSKTYTATCTFNGTTYTDTTESETIPATGHNWQTPTFTWAEDYSTCSASFTCANDSNHTEVVGCIVDSETEAATCTVAGKTVYTATVTFDGAEYSDQQTVTIPATGHTTEIQNAKAATCTEDGYTGDTVCTVCGETISTGEFISATGHTYVNGVCTVCGAEEPTHTHAYTSEVTTEATCTEDGVMTYTCTECGDNYTETIPATGHTAGETVLESEVAATCTEYGSYDEVVYCTVCGEELSREAIAVPATGHDYVAEPTEPTCTEEGYITYTCINCGDSYTGNETEATGHTAGETVVENKVDPTCTEDGSYDEVVYCTECDEELSRETVTVPATGNHAYELDEDASTEPTCTEDGENVYVCAVCGDTYTETVDATGHAYEAVVTAPTCTAGGYTTYTCSVCGDSYTADETEATGHTAGEAVVENEVAASHTAGGSYDEVVYCSVCGEELSRETISVPAGGHTAGETVVENEVDPTCTEDGSYDEVVYCTECDEELSRETVTVPASGHTAGETVVENEVDATCTEPGSYDSVIYCTVCDAELNRETITVPANGHSYESVVTEPTCTAGGYTTYTCSVCGDTYVADETEATGHDYEAIVTEPTCTVGGYTTYTCSVCGDTYVADETEATGHSYEAVVTEPTCTVGGYTTYTCSVCGDTYVADETEATGHTYVDGVCTVCGAAQPGEGEHTHAYTAEVTTEATCTTDGVLTYTCACGDSYTEVIPATGHNYVTAVTEPTCTEGGYTTYTCSICGDSYTTDETEATGHSYEAVVTEPTCTEGGYTTYTCSVCGDTYVADETEATGHTYVDGVCTVCGAAQPGEGEHTHAYTAEVTTEATCTTDGVLTYTCACGDSYTEVIPATGHTTEIQNAKDATCTEDGYTGDEVCTVCGETVTSGEVIPATGHNYVDGVCTVCGEKEPGESGGSGWGGWSGLDALSNMLSNLRNRFFTRLSYLFSRFW
ncbi:MAG: hypothetical protein LUF28_01630 [Clostridiales bacterium]|nr:hypothetical protein [Clostridiales bacterium]